MFRSFLQLISDSIFRNPQILPCIECTNFPNPTRCIKTIFRVNPNLREGLYQPAFFSNVHFSKKKGVWRSKISWLFLIHYELSENQKKIFWFFTVFWGDLEGVGWISPHLLDHPKTLWKTKKIFFAFLKVHNELGKVTKFGTSRPLFSWRNSHLKKGRADSAPPYFVLENGLFWWKKCWLTQLR